MQRKSVEPVPDAPKSRPTSRRNSTSTPRRNCIKDEKNSPLSSAPGSASSTPKKVVKPPLDFLVTGRQILKKYDRANSLPGSQHRRPAGNSNILKRLDSTRAPSSLSHSSKSQETTLEDEYSLDLSQVSDFEDTNSKYGDRSKFKALATSTPKSHRTMLKQRSGSLQSHDVQKRSLRCDSFIESQKSWSNRDSLCKTSSIGSNRYGTDLDYSSVSPENSGPSSSDLSPRAPGPDAVTPDSQDLFMSSCCVSSFQDCSEFDNTKTNDFKTNENGEWSSFWANYNNSISKVPMKHYYDQCPTPFRTDNIDLADLDYTTASESARVRSPGNIRNLNNIICNEGLHLSPREAQNMIKCAHILNNVLTKAIERRRRQDIGTDKQQINSEKEDTVIEKKRTMTLDLKETNIPLEVKEEKRCETVTTQTDISLPNTKSAPIIFENILRQLSKSSIDANVEVKDVKVDTSKEEHIE